MASHCKTCGRDLINDEIALYKRLVNRGANEYLCLDCLSLRLSCDRELLENKIDEFRKSGCTLFATK